MKDANFKDHFSGHSDDYQVYRPRYPAALYEFLSSLCTGHARAWDCATGTGQAAVGLADFFAEVIATDASSNQVESASKRPNISYRVAPAEQSGIEVHSVDLVTVAQAIHWFDLQRFRSEVDRVLGPGAVVAVWSYGLLTINAAIDSVVNHLYGPVLDSYWPPERKFIEEGYRNVEFDYEQLETPAFSMTTEWELSQLVGYLNTWSAVKKYIEQNQTNPVDLVYPDLLKAWGSEQEKYKASWPLTLLVWRKPE